MELPGIKAQHAIITDTCRQNRGDEGAIDEALARLKQEYLATLKFWPIGKDVTFHVALTVDKPVATRKDRDDFSPERIAAQDGRRNG